MMSRGAPHIGRWQGGCLDNIAKELSTILHSGFNFSKKKCNLEKLPQHAKVRREDLSLLLIWISPTKCCIKTHATTFNEE